MRKLLKKQGFAPKLLVTDKLRSYASASARSAQRFLSMHAAVTIPSMFNANGGFAPRLWHSGRLRPQLHNIWPSRAIGVCT
jgi:hypothetical protein